MVRVLASMTTIPSRAYSGALQQSIDSLLAQTRAPDMIYLSIPTKYERFPASRMHDLPVWLSEAPYAGKVQVLRPCIDPGPIAKCLTLAEQLFSPSATFSEHDLQNTVIFVGDDDQVYHPTLLERMLNAYEQPSITKPCVLQNRYDLIVRYSTAGMIYGYVGYLVSAMALRALMHLTRSREAFFVDDQVLSIYFAHHKIPIYASGIETYPEIYGDLQNGHEKGVRERDALHMVGNRDECIEQVQKFYGYIFTEGGAAVRTCKNSKKKGT